MIALTLKEQAKFFPYKQEIPHLLQKPNWTQQLDPLFLIRLPFFLQP